MKIGICTSPEKIASLKVKGLSYVEGTVADILCPTKDEAAFAERLAVVKTLAWPMIAVNVFFPKEMKTIGPDLDTAAVDRHVATACRRAAQAGIGIIVYGSGASRQVPDGFDRAAAVEQIAANLKRWGKIAADCDVTIVIEPLNSHECNVINSVSEGAALARRVNHPNIRLLADTYHMARDAELPDSIRQAGQNLIRHVHCAEAGGRVPLGFGGEDHRPYFKALKDIGYSGGVSIEAKFEDFSSQIQSAVDKLRQQIESA